MFKVKYEDSMLPMFVKWHSECQFANAYWKELLEEKTGIHFEHGYLGGYFVVFPSEDDYLLFVLKYG